MSYTGSTTHKAWTSIWDSIPGAGAEAANKLNLLGHEDFIKATERHLDQLHYRVVRADERVRMMEQEVKHARRFREQAATQVFIWTGVGIASLCGSVILAIVLALQ